MEGISSFEQDYNIMQIEEIPSAHGDVYYYPGASLLGGHSDCMVLVTPFLGKSWIACFENGKLALNARSGIFKTSDRRFFCVVCRGKGYIIQSDSPLNVLYVQNEPICDVRYLFEQGLLLFISPWYISAYGKSGLIWETDRISAEGITVKSIIGNQMYVETEEGKLIIDLNNGQIQQ